MEGEPATSAAANDDTFAAEESNVNESEPAETNIESFAAEGSNLINEREAAEADIVNLIAEENQRIEIGTGEAITGRILVERETPALHTNQETIDDYLQIVDASSDNNVDRETAAGLRFE